MSSLSKCAAMKARAKLLQGAWDEGPEGSRVTSCPSVDETMPSVNKPTLVVITEAGLTIGGHLKCVPRSNQRKKSVQGTLK